MSNNVISIGLATVTLAVAGYVAVVVSADREGGDPGLREELAAIDARLERLEGLQSQVESLERSVGRQLDRVVRRIETAPSGVAAEATGAGAGATAEEGRAGPGAASMTGMEEAIASRLEKRLGEKMEKIADRNRDRNMSGEWKAPFDELSKELALTEDQQREARAIFDEARDEIFVLLKTTRLDGGSLLDDFAAALKNGDDPGEATKGLFQRIFTDKVPGTDRTYLTDLLALKTDVRAALSRHVDEGQVKKLDGLRVDLLDVQTGYDPVGDYVRAKVQ